jgi:predicted DCC family thiol-disulfide oxidoreductase YuxK
MPDRIINYEPKAGARGKRERPVLLYDARCGFCSRWVARWHSYGAGVVDYEPYQQAGADFPDLSIEEMGRAIHLVEPSGRVSKGAEAVLRHFALSGRHRGIWWAYQWVPGFARYAETVYRVVAAHRDAADRLDRLLIGSQPVASTYFLTRQIFLRLLGVIYLIAFASLWVQIDGLIGSDGILPVAAYLKAIYANYGSQSYWLLPTLCWLNSSNAFLHFLCGGGVVAAVMVVCGVLQLPALVVLWAFYLSLTLTGQVFLEFQWDALLLEAGFLAILFASWQIGIPRWWRTKGKLSPMPSHLVLWLLRWLLFRVMFMSGVVKLASGDMNWRGLQAMKFHYETQPLPTWTSWYFAQFPGWFQVFSCGTVFFFELLIPLLIFTPRRPRLLAFWGIIFFQLLIAGTGNYGFFNLLTIVLCFTLTDDIFWRWLFRLRQPAIVAPSERSRWRWPAWVTVPIAVVLLAATIPRFVGAFQLDLTWPEPVGLLEQWVGPLDIANGYGLFMVMTTSRPELIIQGSDDGEHWKDYRFKWKMGDVYRRPEFVIGHMPRLDWQMWFAAGNPGGSPWLVRFLNKLWDGSPAVLQLLAYNPFPDHPPTLLRIELYNYHFTDRATRRATGAWWRRDLLHIYGPFSR